MGCPDPLKSGLECLMDLANLKLQPIWQIDINEIDLQNQVNVFASS